MRGPVMMWLTFGVLTAFGWAERAFVPFSIGLAGMFTVALYAFASEET